MKTRAILSVLTLLGCAWQANAFVLTGHYYPNATFTFNTGDLCDTVNYPGTPVPCNVTDWQAEFDTALGRWGATSAAFTFVSNPAAVGGACVSTDPNSTYFQANFCAMAFGATTLAVAATFSAALPAGNLVPGIHSEIIFNTNQTWTVTDAAAGQSAPFDFRRVAVHEQGHVLGLSHTFINGAIMLPAIATTIVPQLDDIAGANAIYRYVEVGALPDINANTFPDFVVGSGNFTGGPLNATVFDGAILNPPTVLSSMQFFTTNPANWTPSDETVVPNADGAGATGLALLVTDLVGFAGNNFVQVRNALNGNLIGAGTIQFFNSNWDASDVFFVPNAAGAGTMGIGVLALAPVGFGLIGVQVRNLADGALIGSTVIFFNSSWIYNDMTVIPDAAGAGTFGIAVSAFSSVTGGNAVQIRNAVNGAVIGTYHNNLNVNWLMIQLESVPDLAGTLAGPELAVAAVNVVTGSWVIRTMDVGTGATSTGIPDIFPVNPVLWAVTGFSVMDALPSDANAGPEYAVHQVNANTLSLVKIIDIGSGVTYANRFPANTNWAPRGLEIQSPYPSNPGQEILFIGDNIDNNQLVQHMDADTGAKFFNVFP